MHNKPAEVQDLNYWLSYIASVHPREIDLGLERIQTVVDSMGIGKPASKVVVIAGTNGKGSCVSSMEAILVNSGLQVGSYTSPHIHNYNERIRLNGVETDSELICAAFAEVDRCRKAISLSYFEYSTLAALWIFSQRSLDVCLLEVGLGGRLDAVNIVDGDVTVITSIGLDHQDWLGNSLAEIGLEKAGILRPNIPLVYGDRVPLTGILKKAQELDAPVYRVQEDFAWEDAEPEQWHWRGSVSSREQASLENLPKTELLTVNVAIALQALQLLKLEIDQSCIRAALQSLHLAGRQELRSDQKTGIQVLLDVAHNIDAMGALAVRIAEIKQNKPSLSHLSVVMAVMADKDIEEMASALESCVDIWYIAQVDEPRCMPAAEAAHRLERSTDARRIVIQDSATTAYALACRESENFEATNPGQDSLVVVVGSFLTVAAVREFSNLAS